MANLRALLALALPTLLTPQLSAAAPGNPNPNTPPPLKATRWTPTSVNIPDPVAISFDPLGRAYVSQTQRRKAQDLDIREHQDWVPIDISLQSVDEKRAFFHSELAPERSVHNATRSALKEDFNEDGSHDWRDLTVLSERIWLVLDSNGDGIADHASVFAEDFQTEVTGVAAGVLWHDHNVYATIAPDLWKLTDTTGDDKADRREIVATGFGVHLGYGGHDMHGLAIGPDGRIYWSIGDKALSVVSKEEKVFHLPREGAVLRAEPDGSHFEIFARGLRNLQEFAFDDYGNMFGVDNDADNAGERERFVYVVEGSDAGWRINWQLQKGDYNVWMEEGLWKPWHEGQPAYIVPPIRNYLDGPSGFAFNPGTALSPEYRGYFFLSQFPSGNIDAFQVKPLGASFEMVNEHRVASGFASVGSSWGPDGALYVVDWGGGYPLNQTGAIWRLDATDLDQATTKARKETASLLGQGFDERDTEQLTSLLAHPDQRVRLGAQFQLVARDNKETLCQVAADTTKTVLPRIHALWGLGQLLRQNPDSLPNFNWNPLVTAQEPEIRAQTIKTLAIAGENRQCQLHALNLLNDPSPRVRFHAAMALSKVGDNTAVAPLTAFAGALNPDEPYLRHAAVMALTACATPETLAANATLENSSIALISVLALRRQASDMVAEFLAHPAPFVVDEAARAIHDDDAIPKALPALAASLGEPPSSSEAFLRRALNANFRIGTSPQADRLAAFAANEQNPHHLRLEALWFLENWPHPPAIDRVENNHRPLDPRDPAVAARALQPHLHLLLAQNDSFQTRALELARTLNIRLDPAALTPIAANPEARLENRLAALEYLHQQDRSGVHTPLIAQLARDPSNEIKIAAIIMLAESQPEQAYTLLAALLDSPLGHPDRQLAFAALPSVDDDGSLTSAWLDRLLQNEVPRACRLDLIEAAQASSLPSVHALLAQYQATVDPNPMSLAALNVCLEGGDSAKGRDIFHNHPAAQCVLCHSDGKKVKGSEVGPNLFNVGKEKSLEYLLESLANPSAQIAPGYGLVSVTLKNGDSLAGLLVKETDQHLIVNLASEEKKDPLDEIATKTTPISSMPPMAAILTKRELRDVIAYLRSLKE